MNLYVQMSQKEYEDYKNYLENKNSAPNIIDSATNLLEAIKAESKVSDNARIEFRPGTVNTRTYNRENVSTGEYETPDIKISIMVRTFS